MNETHETPRSIREFWFGPDAPDDVVADRQAPLWWAKNAETDATIARRFTGCIEQAAAGALDDWTLTPEGRLALILLTDQFPRNVFRGSPRAFAFDEHARRWCREGLDAGIDRQLRAIDRVFFYLPLEHSELLADQERCVTLVESLRDDAVPSFRKAAEGFLDFAVRHRDIVRRFGRFPHRNDILGRTSSPEETAFLQQPGSSF
ncbi:MAG: DUF924 family protein [Betaproteobacteria bacterium]|nr:DUF924 family protein [Betaproteobacteria bacterium]